jgi:hypothetical protein
VLLACGVVCVAASVDAGESEQFPDCETRERDTEADAGDDHEHCDDGGHLTGLTAKLMPDRFGVKAAKTRGWHGGAVTFLAE